MPGQSSNETPLIGAHHGKRVALITGGARRIGKACCLELSQRGWDLAIHANRSTQEAERLAASLAEQHGVRCEAFQAELADERAAQELIEQVSSRFGRLDALVNSAAVWPKQALEDVTADDVRDCLDVNTVSVFVASRAAGLRMSQQESGGVIINLGDAALAHDGKPYLGYAAYHPSKAAIPGMTRAMALELAERNPRVRVNAVLPGPVLCDALPNEPEETPEHRRHVRREAIVATLEGDSTAKDEACGRAEHVAHAVAFLIENPFVSGVCLPVDGGGRLR